MLFSNTVLLGARDGCTLRMSLTYPTMKRGFAFLPGILIIAAFAGILTYIIFQASTEENDVDVTNTATVIHQNANTDVISTADWKAFSNTEYHYSLRMPTTYEVFSNSMSKVDESNDLVVYDAQGSALIDPTIDTVYYSGGIPGVRIYLKKLDSGQTLKQFVDMEFSKTQTHGNTTSPVIERLFNTINGYRFQMNHAYSGIDADFLIYPEQDVFIGERNGYVFRIMKPVELSTKSVQAVLNAIADSFQFTD